MQTVSLGDRYRHGYQVGVLISLRRNTMKKLITTLALVSSIALTGAASIASAQTTGNTGTGNTGTNNTTGVTNGTTGTTNTGTAGNTGSSASTTGTTGTGSTGSTGSQGASDTSGSSTVGVPNTGAGGDAPINYAILATSAAIAIGAAAYAFRKPRMR